MAKNIVKINIALSDQPLYVSLDDVQMSIDTIFNEAVTNLRDQGRQHEAQQLAQLYNDHQVFNQGTLVAKGTVFNDLKKETREIQGEEVNFAEIELIRQHVGGI